MAAAIAIMLFMEVPRVAFESQRDKEQLLIDRGEQYTRAVQLYVRKFNRYPADFDALMNTQNIRFLRHKYIDPMTGKDDWRIIHAGPGGTFTDSLVYSKAKTNATGTAQSFITETQQTGGNQGGTAAQGVNIGMRQRASDVPGAPGDPNAAASQGGAANGNPFGGSSNTTEPVMVLPDGRVVPVSQGLAILNGQTPAPQTPQGNVQAPGQIPGQNPQAGVQAPGQPFPNNNAPGNNQFPPGLQQNPNAPGAVPNAFNNPGQPGVMPAGAANMINQMLTAPRPTGVDANGNPVPNNGFNNGAGFNNSPNGLSTNNGFGSAPGTTVTGFGSTPGQNTAAATGNNTGTPLPAMGGQVVGGGIAGVASKLEQTGIKVYKDRAVYNEWEFVYDITKDTSRTGIAPAQNSNANGTAAQGTTAQQNGQNTGFGSNFSFGNSPTGTNSAATGTSQTGSSAPPGTALGTPGRQGTPGGFPTGGYPTGGYPTGGFPTGGVAPPTGVPPTGGLPPVTGVPPIPGVPPTGAVPAPAQPGTAAPTDPAQPNNGIPVTPGAPPTQP